MDELNSLIRYYSKSNIKKIVSDPNSKISNFHGKVSQVKIGGST